MKLNDSALPANYIKGLYEEKCYDLAPEHTDKILDVLFTGTSNLLGQIKSKEQPTALVFETVDGKFIAAAIVRCIENEDSSNPDAWNLVWTFYESDLPENTKIISLKDQMAHPYFRSIAGEKYGFRFKDTGSLLTLLTYALEHIRKWLDENASETETVVIEQDAVFQARVAVENGEKVFAIEPMGEIKKLIKDDASLEK